MHFRRFESKYAKAGVRSVGQDAFLRTSASLLGRVSMTHYRNDGFRQVTTMRTICCTKILTAARQAAFTSAGLLSLACSLLAMLPGAAVADVQAPLVFV